MSAARSRREQLAYRAYRKTVPAGICVFCVIPEGDDQLLEEYTHFRIIKNIYSYSLWDGQRVLDHIMVVPRTHTDRLDMTDEQKIEFVDILHAYETKGYNVYARAPASSIKTVVHQHTHLIKTGGKSVWFLWLLQKPYIRLIR